MRGIVLGTLVCLLLACDAMILDRLVIVPENASGQEGAGDELIAVARSALIGCGARAEHLSEGGTLSVDWRDPDSPPGLSIQVYWEAAEWRILMSQDLYGQTGRTEIYKCTYEAMHDALRTKFGGEQLRVE